MSDLNLQLVLRFIDQATRPARAAMRTLEQTGQSMEANGRAGAAAARQNATAAAGWVAALGTALYSTIRPAMEMETRMAEISKVVDFDPAGLKELQAGIFELTTSGGLPMAADGIADIIAAAGRAGVVDKALPDDEERRQLLAFATSAAQMGVAFDISAGAAAEAMVAMRNRMKLSQDQVLALADAINHLGNNSAAGSADILAVISRQGATAKEAGLAAQEIAALSAAFVGASESPEIAATALKNFTSALTAGEAATSRERKVLQDLGFDAENLAKRMQEDARGSILDVMDALEQLPDDKRGAAVRQLFGEESSGAIMPLLTNLDALREAFELVADSESFSGSMLDEFLKIAGTTESQITLLRNNLDRLRSETGEELLPGFRSFVEWLIPSLEEVAAWVDANGSIVQAVVLGVGGLAVVRLAWIAIQWLTFGAMGLIGQLLIKIGLLAGPWGAIAAAAIAAGWLIWSNWDEMIDLLQNRLKMINVGGFTDAGNAIPLRQVEANGWNYGQTGGMTREQMDYPFSPYYTGDKRPFQFNGASMSPLAVPSGDVVNSNNATRVDVGGIIVNAPPGADAEEVAAMVESRLRGMTTPGAALHDGDSYVD